MEKNTHQKTKSPPCTKWTTYFITFMAYLSLHTMRMSYSQVKYQIERDYHQNNLFLGIMDSFVYISLGIGFFFRFLLNGNMGLRFSYVVYVEIAIIAYLIIPVSSLIFGQRVQQNILLREIMPSVGLLLFGFCQFAAWPTLLTLMSEHFDHTTEGKALGFWSANGNLGNILGFAMTGLLVDVLKLQWEFAMIAAAGFSFFMILLVVIFVKEKKKEWRELKQECIHCKNQTNSEEKVAQQLEKNESNFKKFLHFSRKILSKTENILYLVSMGLLKSILYGFILWMPTYLADLGLTPYKAVLPIAFDSGTLIGSFALGHFYNKKLGNEGVFSSILTNFRNYSLLYCCLGTTALLLLFYVIKVNIWAYLIISALCGAFLGGAFNMMASNEVISIVDGKKEDVNMLSTLSMVFGNLMVGFLQIIIGVTLSLKKRSSQGQSLFMLLILVGFVTITILYWRSRILLSLKNQLKE